MFCELLVETFTLPKFKLETLEFSNKVAAAVTVRVAPLLVTLPAALVMVTLNTEPLLAVVVAGVM